MSAPVVSTKHPGFGWRALSALVMGKTAIFFKIFLYGFNSVEVVGLRRFIDLVDKRCNIEDRERGLITVSNHMSVLDDPLIWGVLPLRITFNPSSCRWSLGAHDICFKNKLSSSFFTYGQVLPTRRLAHSPHGGLFQPTITQAIRLLSSQPFFSRQSASRLAAGTSVTPDPFSDGALTFSTNGSDSFPAPSAYHSRRHSWIHVFPEGSVHQNPQASMRYFRWGVSRLILEAEPMPDLVPMFIDGTKDIMPETRGWPRFIPRVGKKVKVVFGDVADAERTFGDLRARWRRLVEKDGMEDDQEGVVLDATVTMVGELSDELKYGGEAEEIRIEVAARVRNEVLKLRRSLGYPEEDQSLGLAETWEIDKKASKKARISEVDGSIVSQE